MGGLDTRNLQAVNGETAGDVQQVVLRWMHEALMTIVGSAGTSMRPG